MYTCVMVIFCMFINNMFNMLHIVELTLTVTGMLTTITSTDRRQATKKSLWKNWYHRTRSVGKVGTQSCCRSHCNKVVQLCIKSKICPKKQTTYYRTLENLIYSRNA